MEPITLVRLIDRLHELGLAERRAQAGDRRVRTLWLTEAARPVVARILAVRKSISQEALADLSPEAVDGLLRALRSIRAQLLALPTETAT
jgi:MarR family transcriptional regulator for hemolysin